MLAVWERDHKIDRAPQAVLANPEFVEWEATPARVGREAPGIDP
jgi:hypothetical protein